MVKPVINIPSRFLDEMPAHCLKWLQAAPQQPINPYQSENPTVKKANFIQQPASSSQWRIGQNVQHAKFGLGVIVNYEGSGSDARVQVNFNRVGTKWLLLEYAKLAAV